MGLKNRGRTGGPRTNIGASVPVPFSTSTGAFTDRRNGLPVAFPVAQFADEAPNPQVIAQDPLWISRWQNSATVKGERPWVKGYRWWSAGVRYQTWGPTQDYRIDFLWKDHRHAYHGIPKNVWDQFRTWTGSVGVWFHQMILVPNWSKGKGARYPNFPL